MSKFLITKHGLKLYQFRLNEHTQLELVDGGFLSFSSHSEPKHNTSWLETFHTNYFVNHLFQTLPELQLESHLKI